MNTLNKFLRETKIKNMMKDIKKMEIAPQRILKLTAKKILKIEP